MSYKHFWCIFLLITALSLAKNVYPASKAEKRTDEMSYKITVNHAELHEAINNELKEIKVLVTNDHVLIKEYIHNIKIYGGLFSILLFIAGFIGYPRIRKWFKGIVENKIQFTVANAVNDRLPTLLSNTQKRAEEYLLRLAKLLALRAHGDYDQALLEYKWDGNTSSLRNEAVPLRRAIIECLYSTKRDREDNRKLAWVAISELVTDDNSPETLQLLLRICISSRKYLEGINYYDKYKDDILRDKDSSLKAATLLRKTERHKEALDIVSKYKNDNDITSLVSVAVIERDLGNFDKCHDILYPAVNKLVTSPSVSLPEGWHRLLNTFIANCYDRDHPWDAIQPAEFVLRSAPGSVELFTVGRLLLSLPTDNKYRIAMFEKYKERVSTVMPGEAYTRCRVVLEQLENRISDAIYILEEEIEKHEASKGPMDIDHYYFRCTLGKILIDNNNVSDAIDIMMPAAECKYGGEAKYYLALAYGRQGEGKDSVRWLKSAISELPKWAVHARDNDILKSIPEITGFLANLGRT